MDRGQAKIKWKITVKHYSQNVGLKNKHFRVFYANVEIVIFESVAGALGEKTVNGMSCGSADCRTMAFK